MKYESDILKRLIKTYGVVGNPRYISEIIKEFIVRGKECFPNLFTYQADWLAHIDEFGLNPSYTVRYTGQSIYAPNTLERPVKSAILKGSTKYRDIDTGEFLETFEEGRNLELVSVEMPVLCTTGKNLVSNMLPLNSSGGNITTTTVVDSSSTIASLIEVGGNITLTVSKENKGSRFRYFMYRENPVKGVTMSIGGQYVDSSNTVTFTTQPDTKYLLVVWCGDKNIDYPINPQIEYGNQVTPYEPYKSNILTVNEDVTLRSNGDICDELNLLTGQLTQRIGEDGSVLTQEVVKTVDLTILDQNGQSVDHLKSFNGGTHVYTSSLEGSLVPSVDISVVTNLEETLKICSLEGNTM